MAIAAGGVFLRSGPDLCSSALGWATDRRNQQKNMATFHKIGWSARHSPTPVVGNMFIFVHFLGIFICFRFWWIIKHHVRGQ